MGNAINRALTQLDTLQKSDNRFRGVARAGLLMRTASRQTVQQPPVKAIVKTTPAPAAAAQPVPQQVKTTAPQPEQRPRRWGEQARFIGDCLPTNVPKPTALPQRSTPATPPPTLAQSLLASRIDTSGFSGRQLAAMRAGCPIDHPDLNNMSFQDMRQVGNQINIDAARKQAEAQGIYRGPAGETYHRK